MKSLALVVLLSSLAMACPKGQTEWESVCTVDIQPEGATVDSSKWVSDAKPPKTTTGEWQTGTFQVIQLKSQTLDDEITSAQKWDAAHPAKK
jgi:hypothetical protein